MKNVLILQMQQAQLVESDIEKALGSFEKNFKVPSSVLEARYVVGCVECYFSAGDFNYLLILCCCYSLLPVAFLHHCHFGQFIIVNNNNIISNHRDYNNKACDSVYNPVTD